MSSKNKYDVFAWLKSVVESCETREQKRSAINLVRNFKRQFDISFLEEHVLDSELMFMELKLMGTK